MKLEIDLKKMTDNEVMMLADVVDRQSRKIVVDVDFNDMSLNEINKISQAANRKYKVYKSHYKKKNNENETNENKIDKTKKKNTNKKWTNSEITRLKTLVHNGYSNKEIAKRMDRSVHSIIKKLYKIRVFRVYH